MPVDWDTLSEHDKVIVGEYGIHVFKRIDVKPLQPTRHEQWWIGSINLTIIIGALATAAYVLWRIFQ